MACPRLPRRGKLCIVRFPGERESSLTPLPLLTQNKASDLFWERKNGEADMEPARVSAAAKWNAPVLTPPPGANSARPFLTN